MNEYLTQFVEINKNVITDILMLVTDAGEKLCFIILSGKCDESSYPLLVKACHDAGEYLDVDFISPHYANDASILKGVIGDAVSI